MIFEIIFLLLADDLNPVNYIGFFRSHLYLAMAHHDPEVNLIRKY
jgi:hypothetical protein